MLGTLYLKKMEYERQYRKRLEAKQMRLGPCLFTDIRTKNTVLEVPQAWYDKNIWQYWIDKGFRWEKAEHCFHLIITGKSNPEKWLERAIARFNELWYGW